jgi:Methyltransferase domain/C-methyltransferase C-terminal domain
MDRICEVCEQLLKGPILDLGFHPLCDDLAVVGNMNEVPRYHQKIQLCTNCLTAHQLVPVKKELLFKADYHYRAKLTKDVLNGMSELVEAVKRFNYFSDENPHIVDIGCNDGSLLRIFKESFKCTTIGVDPTNAIQESVGTVDHRYQGFFDEEIAQKIKESTGFPDLITFTNVFAHIENLPSLISSLKILLNPDTMVVIENHYLGSILDQQQIDTFYHEHPRTYSAKSFTFIAKSLGLEIMKIEYPKRYGGNIRVWMGSKDAHNVYHPRVDQGEESNFSERFESLQDFYDKWKENAQSALSSLTTQGPIYGKSLPGRAVMLISSLGLDKNQMPVVFEQDSSPKVGYYVPGTQMEIHPDSQILDLRPSRIVVWAWHIADEICEYLEGLGYKGEVWVPLPEFKIFRILN